MGIFDALFGAIISDPICKQNYLNSLHGNYSNNLNHTRVGINTNKDSIKKEYIDAEFTVIENKPKLLTKD